jgi:hypothetical protein
MNLLIKPLLTETDGLITTMKNQGYAVFSAETLSELSHIQLSVLETFNGTWQNLPTDKYLKDGGRYRYRRHSCFIADGEKIEQMAHRAHWQPIAYNALHGGMERWFEPISDELTHHEAWLALLRAFVRVCHELKPTPLWYIEAHQFRIDTTDGIGRPTPEGAHRDGVDFVVVIMVDRHDIKGGETRVFEASGPSGQRFTLSQPWSVLFIDDERVIHESTPIQPLDDMGHRDTLVLTFRRGGFQDVMG